MWKRCTCFLFLPNDRFYTMTENLCCNLIEWSFKIGCAHGSWQHLQSDQHRAFVLDPSNYSAVDQLVAEMLPGFDPDPPEQPEETLHLCVDFVFEIVLSIILPFYQFFFCSF